MIQEDWPEWPSPERLKEIDAAFAAEFGWSGCTTKAKPTSRFIRILERLGLKRPSPQFVHWDAISDPTPWPPADGEPPGA